MSVLVGEEWFEAAKGSFVLVPGGVTHDFENRGSFAPGFSISRCLVPSSLKCQALLSGLPRTRLRTQAPNISFHGTACGSP
jgi:hypothetical protein